MKIKKTENRIDLMEKNKQTRVLFRERPRICASFVLNMRLGALTSLSC